MNMIRHLNVRLRESAGGQTMAEYALILLAVAVVAFATYQTFGAAISSDVVSVDPLL
jgi:Flp pilus assembly pilin Flp